MQLGPSIKAQKEELRKPSGSPQLKTSSESPQEALRKPSGSPQIFNSVQRLNKYKNIVNLNKY